MKAILKEHFSLPKDVHYFCGHSLGAQSFAAKNAMTQASQEWENHLVSAWNVAKWIDLPQLCGEKIAPLIGAKAHEVIVCDNTTLNLMKLLLCALSINANRNVILTQANNFPTDNYIAQSVAQLQGVTVKVMADDAILDSLDDNVAVLLLTHVNYRSAQKWDMEKIIQRAKSKGILTLWDLSHSVGAMALHCSALEVDFAVGCTYKYLNGGPGAPGFIYVNEKHHAIPTPIQGWMGHQAPFNFSAEFMPATGVARFLTGTPSILSMKALLGALQVFDGIDMAFIEKQSHALSNYFIAQCAKYVPQLQCISPEETSQRGSHVAFSHPYSYALSQALIAQGVIVDYRKPSLIRFGLSSLYNDQADIDKAVCCMSEFMREQIQFERCNSEVNVARRVT